MEMIVGIWPSLLGFFVVDGRQALVAVWVTHNYEKFVNVEHRLNIDWSALLVALVSLTAKVSEVNSHPENMKKVL